MADFTFFGVQIAFRRYHDDTSRARLHRLLSASKDEMSLPDKRAFWKSVVALIQENAPHFEYGYWDLIRGGKAEVEFETWSSEIEAGLATEPDELGTAPDEVHRLGTTIGDARFVIVSALFLVDAETNTDETLGERCDIPEDDYFKAATFGRLVDSIPLMNFANVRADAVYVAPGGERDGISELELREGWEHLKPLQR
jgi:hypothetical protein